MWAAKQPTVRTVWAPPLPGASLSKVGGGGLCPTSPCETTGPEGGGSDRLGESGPRPNRLRRPEGKPAASLGWCETTGCVATGRAAKQRTVRTVGANFNGCVATGKGGPLLRIDPAGTLRDNTWKSILLGVGPNKIDIYCGRPVGAGKKNKERH